MQKLIFSVISLLFTLEQTYAYTVVAPSISDTANLPQPGSPLILMGGIIKYTISIAAILGVIGVTVGWLLMVFAAGEDEKVKKWRYTIIYSLIGVLVAWLAYGIVTAVSGFKL